VEDLAGGQGQLAWNRHKEGEEEVADINNNNNVEDGAAAEVESLEEEVPIETIIVARHQYSDTTIHQC
jgi:hypothetical protein